MITNANATKASSEATFIDVKKFIGVGSVNVLAINPNNAKLRQYGWNIPDSQEEPKYVVTDNQGKKSARVRFLVQVQDLKDKPILAMDFWVRPEGALNSDGSKCKIIDAYGRTAWATKSEFQAHQVPQYGNGPASISSDYKLCHVGEEELVNFMMKYLNVTPLQMLKDGNWVATKNPGTCTYEWKPICNGDVSELWKDVCQFPDNKVKVAFGIRTNDENKSYQTFLNTKYFGNGSRPGPDGEYTAAKNAIEKFKQNRPNAPVTFSAEPIHEWSVTATEVKEADDMPASFSDASFFTENKDDLPFGD